ncbi:MAG: hypothetical protein ACO3EE_05870 [Flavobacteriales bacterium]
MKKALFILLILVAQISVAEDKTFVTASSPDGKYSINHLKGWTPTFGSGNVLVSLKGSGGNSENIPVLLALTKEENIASTLTLDDFAARNFILIKNMLNATVTERGTATINGAEAQTTTYTYDINERTHKGLVYFFIQNGNAYQLVIHSAVGDFSEPVFKQIAESLTIK